MNTKADYWDSNNMGSFFSIADNWLQKNINPDLHNKR